MGIYLLIVTILGTRPEITKLSPLLPKLDKLYRHKVIFTGQHYDRNMSASFFKELGLRRPDRFLTVGKGSQGKQTGSMLEKLEKELMRLKPRLVIVQGDTNSALAGALAAAKLKIPVLHVEAGCRSFNRNAPEEINRIVIDHIAEALCAADRVALENLRREGLGKKSILTGSTSLESAQRLKPMLSEKRLRRFNVKPGNFVLVTFHRAENTDHLPTLRELAAAIEELAKDVTVIFPMHPRSRKALSRARIKLSKKIRVVEPLGQRDFLSLLSQAKFILSDSGGIQEEAAVYNCPCLILREETEWTRLVKAKKNFLVGTKKSSILKVARALFFSSHALEKVRKRKVPLDFRASERILSSVRKQLRRS